MNKNTSKSVRKQGYITASDWTMPDIEGQMPKLDWQTPDIDWKAFDVDMQGFDIDWCSNDIDWMKKLQAETPANTGHKPQGRKSHIVKP